MWSKIISRGKTLRLTDIDGGANVSMLLYNARERLERYNMPDTLKGQQIFYLTAPYCLHSDMGRLFCSITEDTAGWHDTVCGCSDASLVEKKYGTKTYQESHNDFYRNGRENFIIELAKWGLGKRDLVPNINWFSKVKTNEAGDLTFDASAGQAGSHIDLRFEMDTLVVLHTCQHPLDPTSEYAPKSVELSVRVTPAPGPEDLCRRSCPENERAFENTEDYYHLCA